MHGWQQADRAAEGLDILRMPAFLCRQTDLIAAAARTGKAVGVKKGQFLSPEEAKNILDKGREAGNERVFITERGSSFGYQNLVVDMRAFPILRGFGAPVVYDITHSMQKPGGEGKQTGGTPPGSPGGRRPPRAVPIVRLEGGDRRFVETRSRDSAERTLETAISEPGQLAAVESMMVAAVTDHVFVDGGHTIDFTNKGFEALDLLDS